jgi:hypothetical protein
VLISSPVPDQTPCLPLPRWEPAVTVVAPEGDGPGNWVGAPSALLVDGTYYLAYRLRRPVGEGRGFGVVIASSADGERVTEIARISREPFGAESLERPALVRRPDGGWRIYVSCATPGTKHWRVDVIDADTPAGFDVERRVTSMPGDARTAVKDPVVHAPVEGGPWRAWVCCHPLEQSGAEDRMVTRLAISDDGLDWRMGEIVLAGRDGEWDQRGARITAVAPDASWAFYDGRVSAEENFEERAGWAVASGDDSAFEVAGGPIGSPHGRHGMRYLDAVALPGGGYRLFYEAARADGAHEVRTEVVMS